MPRPPSIFAFCSYPAILPPPQCQQHIVLPVSNCRSQSQGQFRGLGRPLRRQPGGDPGRLGIDVIFPRGFYYANDSGGLDARTITWDVQARTIDDDGVATGAWITLGSETHTAATNTAIRLSFKYPVTSGRYEVQLLRTDSKDTSSRAGHELRWVSLRSYLTGAPDFGDVTLLAVKMRATDNLSQRSSRMINCIVTRRLPVWDTVTGWSAPQPTRSIAWAFADACRAAYGATLAQLPHFLGQNHDFSICCADI